MKVTPPSHFSLRNATEFDILKILLILDISKRAGSDKLPQKIIHLAAPITACPLTAIINNSNESSVFQDLLKIACIVPVFKRVNALIRKITGL